MVETATILVMMPQMKSYLTSTLVVRARSLTRPARRRHRRQHGAVALLCTGDDGPLDPDESCACNGEMIGETSAVSAFSAVFSECVPAFQSGPSERHPSGRAVLSLPNRPATLLPATPASTAHPSLQSRTRCVPTFCSKARRGAGIGAEHLPAQNRDGVRAHVPNLRPALRITERLGRRLCHIRRDGNLHIANYNIFVLLGTGPSETQLVFVQQHRPAVPQTQAAANFARIVYTEFKFEFQHV